jgi:uncharacterized membrane protein YfcA
VAAPALGGAAIGVWAALNIPDLAFRRLLSIIMLGMTLVTVLRRSLGGDASRPVRSPWHWTMVGGFFLVGVYGGFIQAGVGFLILSMTTLAGLDLVKGNAIKVFTILLLTILSLVVFAGTGNVNWPAGIALGIGNVAGGWLGVRLAILRGHRWVEHVVTVTVIVFAALLWFTD